KQFLEGPDRQLLALFLQLPCALLLAGHRRPFAENQQRGLLRHVLRDDGASIGQHVPDLALGVGFHVPGNDDRLAEDWTVHVRGRVLLRHLVRRGHPIPGCSPVATFSAAVLLRLLCRRRRRGRWCCGVARRWGVGFEGCRPFCCIDGRDVDVETGL